MIFFHGCQELVRQRLAVLREVEEFLELLLQLLCAGLLVYQCVPHALRRRKGHLRMRNTPLPKKSSWSKLLCEPAIRSKKYCFVVF